MAVANRRAIVVALHRSGLTHLDVYLDADCQILLTVQVTYKADGIMHIKGEWVSTTTFAMHPEWGYGLVRPGDKMTIDTDLVIS